MAVNINADTIVGGAVVTADASGVLALQAAGNTGLTLNSSRAIGVGASPSFGTSGQVLTSAGSAAAPTWTTVSSGFTLGTPVATTSGTSIDFTGIPAGTKQIIINFNGVSTNGVDNYFFQLGDAGGIETTGYLSASSRIQSDATTLGYVSSTSAFVLLSGSAACIYSGSLTLTLENSSLFTWCASGAFVSTSGILGVCTMAGRHTLSQQLNQIRVTTQGGTQIFDAGEINIAYI